MYSILFIRSSVDGRLGGFYSFGYEECWYEGSYPCTGFCVDLMFYLLLGRYLEVELLGHITLFNLLKNCQPVFQSSCTILHSCQLCMKVQFLHILTCLLISVFLIIAILVDAEWYLIVALISHVSLFFFICVTGMCMCVYTHTHTHSYINTCMVIDTVYTYPPSPLVDASLPLCLFLCSCCCLSVSLCCGISGFTSVSCYLWCYLCVSSGPSCSNRVWICVYTDGGGGIWALIFCSPPTPSRELASAGRACG